MTPICPACGCSLARLGISRADATSYRHDGEDLLFCCQGCLDVFEDAPERYLAEVKDWVVCPACLGEKPKALTVSIEHRGETVHFCRCPHCHEAFEREPDKLLTRLAV